VNIVTAAVIGPDDISLTVDRLYQLLLEFGLSCRHAGLVSQPCGFIILILQTITQFKWFVI